MSRIILKAAVAAAAVAIFTPGTVDGQIRGSERGSVSQTLDGTVITVDYARPTARGRKLFGADAVVPYDIVWTPGANWATTLETNKPIRLNGVEVAAGAYSVWMTPHADRWTMTLNENTKYFHFQKPDTALGTYHIALMPEQGAHTEMMTWSFPVVSGDAATMQFQWGETVVPMQVIAQPTAAVTLAAQDRALYLGEYDLDVMPGIGWPTEGEFRVSESSDGTLRAFMSFPVHPGDELTFDLVPAGDNRFNPGLYRNGTLFNIETGVAFEFDVSDRAHKVTMRGIEGTPFATGPLTTAATQTHESGTR